MSHNENPVWATPADHKVNYGEFPRNTPARHMVGIPSSFVLFSRRGSFLAARGRKTPFSAHNFP